MAFGPTGVIWEGNDGGVWKSTNGGTSWTNCNNTLAAKVRRTNAEAMAFKG